MMPKGNSQDPQNASRADVGGYSDIDRWRLAVHIFPTGTCAWLKDTADPAKAPRRIMEARWNLQDDSDVTALVENAVYDHPAVLDDFEADVIVQTGKYLAVPYLLAEDEMLRESLYTRFFPAEPDNIFSDYLPGNASLLYSPFPRLKPFLLRTFPGARIAPHAGVLARRALESQEGGLRQYVHIRPGEVDLLALRGQSLLLCGTHPWTETADILYHTLNFSTAADPSGQLRKFLVSGEKQQKAEVLDYLKAHDFEAFPDTMPQMADSDGNPLPASVAICLSRQKPETQS